MKKTLYILVILTLIACEAVQTYTDDEIKMEMYTTLDGQKCRTAELRNAINDSIYTSKDIEYEYKIMNGKAEKFEKDTALLHLRSKIELSNINHETKAKIMKVEQYK